MLQCHDFFVTDLHQYANGFRGPGKYDGSVVNWVNGRLLAADRRAAASTWTSRPSRIARGSNVLTMTARARD